MSLSCHDVPSLANLFGYLLFIYLFVVLMLGNKIEWARALR
jgi:hypothetical protein